jgi:hypothetical protein
MKHELEGVVVDAEYDPVKACIVRLTIEGADIKAETLRKIPIGRIWAAERLAVHKGGAQ